MGLYIYSETENSSIILKYYKKFIKNLLFLRYGLVTISSEDNLFIALGSINGPKTIAGQKR